MEIENIYQILLPDENDTDEHPRLIVNERGIHAGDTFEALFPNGWHEVAIEMKWNIKGPKCWFISTSGYEEFSPIGLFVRM